MKVCTLCKIEKELDAFHMNRTHRQGVASRCKECVAATRGRFITKVKPAKRYKDYLKEAGLTQYYNRMKRNRCLAED